MTAWFLVIALTLAPSRAELKETAILAWLATANPSVAWGEFPRSLLHHARATRLDYRLVLAVCSVESELRPHAVSHKGAVGLCQIMPQTAQDLGARLGIRGDLRDPIHNMRLATVYLRDQVTAFGLGREAFQAYNRGPERAREVWPRDQYAGNVALRYMRIIRELPDSVQHGEHTLSDAW